MSTPKRHHFVPQMLLRRFADSDGRLFFFTKHAPEKGVMKSDPLHIFQERHLYSHIDSSGKKTTRLETFFSGVEGNANRIIEKIVTAARMRQKPRLSAAEKREWDQFVYYQWKRVPDFFERYANENDFPGRIEELIEKFEKNHRPLTDEERISLSDPDTIERIRRNALLDAIADPGHLAVGAMSNRGLGVALIQKPSKSFVVGSFPVVKFSHPGRSELSDPTVELWFPIAADIAVTPGGPAGSEQLILNIADHHIRKINEGIFKQSTVIAGRSMQLVQSITTPR